MKKLLLLPFAFWLSVSAAETANSGPPVALKGLTAAASITRDKNDIAHIRASNEHDLFFLQGYVHAEDRLFQMDATRRQASGTLAELLGPSALAADVQLRTIGLRRAAQRSLAVLSAGVLGAMNAYADGVNAYVATHDLPPEYAVLELTKFEPWTALDSMACAKLIAFGLSFDLGDIDRTVTLLAYQRALGSSAGAALFSEDLFRSAPFDPAATVPDASIPMIAALGDARHAARIGAAVLRPQITKMARTYLAELRGIPFLQRLLDPNRRGGSNEWAISGALTTSGRPLLANDTHLALDIPSTWYPIHLIAEPLNVAGDSFPGVPLVILGQNHHISWGATVNPLDVTDVYQETIVSDPSSPSGLSTVYLGKEEPVIPIPEVFRQNNLDGKEDDVTVVPPGGPIPSATLIVPRRNNGPIIKMDLSTGSGLSVQYTGFSGTREPDAFYAFDTARNIADFERGLQFVDFGSQNFAYSDVMGNIAYFTSAEMPVREDLQAGVVNGLPPYFIRNGAGGNEWLPVEHPQPNQAIPYEILPQDEMPHLINPPAGWFVNANNDPAGNTLDNNPLNTMRPGGGIFYLSPGYSGIRAGRITELIRQKLSTGSKKLSSHDMEEIQADVGLLDAEYFVPQILRAFENAQSSSAPAQLRSLGEDPIVAAMVSRLGSWNFTTPTGIPEGYDAGDDPGQMHARGKAEISASIAAAIYSVWRSQFIRNTIDVPLNAAGLPLPEGQLPLTALRNLLDNFALRQGVGVSGVNFFNVPGVSSAADRRDILILKSLADAYGGLADFFNSPSLADYRWGKLHRIVFNHLLGAPFSIPPAGGAFPPPLFDLLGIPTDGGFETVDAATHDVRADGPDSFMFDSGPARRYVSEAGPGWVMGTDSLPGGISGALGSPYYFNLLTQWLTNGSYAVLIRQNDLEHNAISEVRFVPGR